MQTCNELGWDHIALNAAFHFGHIDAGHVAEGQLRIVK